MFVFSNAVDGKDDAFNKWYDDDHVGDVLDVPGVVAARRYDLAPMKLPEGDDLPAHLPPPPHRYLAVYELDRAPDEVMSDFLDRVGSGNMQLSDTMDLSTLSVTTWRPRGERRSAE
jgi:hypothetical protein